MDYYFAPMECITEYLFRNAHQKYFTAADKYFSPFIAPGKGRKLNQREKKDILPEHNREIYLVPQILTNSAENFLGAAKELERYGYREVNLNLGCPSRGVASKGRGAGFLQKTEELERFLDQIFEKSSVSISIKTRLGMESAEEFVKLMQLFQRFPVRELIIHPRIQKDYYQKPVRKEWFFWAVENSRLPICYNGDLFSAEQFRKWKKKYLSVERVMLGRGLISNPALIGEIKGEERLTAEKLEAFHNEIYQGYLEEIQETEKVLPKMKELWYYLQHMMLSREEIMEGRNQKVSERTEMFEKTNLYLEMEKVKRAKDLKEYEKAVVELFRRKIEVSDKSAGRETFLKGCFLPPAGLGR